MAKKKTNYMSYLPLLAALLGVVALVMLFVPAVVASEDVSYNGLKVAFGYTQSEGGVITINLQHLKFSFMNLLPYILVLVGIVACVMGYKGNKLATFVGFVCFVAAAVLFFLAVSFAVPGSALTLDGTLDAAKVKENWTLGAGAIVAGVCSGVAALFIAASSVLKK